MDHPLWSVDLENYEPGDGWNDFGLERECVTDKKVDKRAFAFISVKDSPKYRSKM